MLKVKAHKTLRIQGKRGGAPPPGVRNYHVTNNPSGSHPSLYTTAIILRKNHGKGRSREEGGPEGGGRCHPILNGYDTFHWSRETLARVADVMILLAVLSLAAVLGERGALAGGSLAGFREIDLTLVLFGLSACIFAVFRAVLFMIEDYMEKVVSGVQGIRDGRFSSGARRNLRSALDSVSSRLQDSITLWWTARIIVIRAVFVIIPGVLFYLLGIANLVMYVIGKGMFPGV